MAKRNKAARRFVVAFTLGELIDADGMDAFNDMVETRLTESNSIVPGEVFEYIGYRIARADGDNIFIHVNANVVEID
jgi:hypothetical protein